MGNYNYRGVRGLANGGVAYAGRVLKALARTYQAKNHKIMAKYWQKEILDFVPEWRKAVALAKDMKTKNPLKSGDAPRMDFSRGFAHRLVHSGYTIAAEVLISDDQNEDDIDDDEYAEVENGEP